MRLICGSADTDADVLSRAPVAMRQTLADMVQTRQRCQRESWTAWREACDAVNPMFLQLLAACGVTLKATEAGLGSFTVPEAGNRFCEHTFTTEGIDYIHVDEEGNFSAHVKMVQGGSHWTETLTFNDGKLALLPDISL